MSGDRFLASPRRSLQGAGGRSPWPRHPAHRPVRGSGSWPHRGLAASSRSPYTPELNPTGGREARGARPGGVLAAPRRRQPGGRGGLILAPVAVAFEGGFTRSRWPRGEPWGRSAASSSSGSALRRRPCRDAYDRSGAPGDRRKRSRVPPDCTMPQARHESAGEARTTPCCPLRPPGGVGRRWSREGEGGSESAWCCWRVWALTWLQVSRSDTAIRAVLSRCWSRLGETTARSRAWSTRWSSFPAQPWGSRRRPSTNS